MSLGLILLIVLIVLLAGGFGNWGPGQFYGGGYPLGGLLGIILIVIVVAMLLGKF